MRAFFGLARPCRQCLQARGSSKRRWAKPLKARRKVPKLRAQNLRGCRTKAEAPSAGPRCCCRENALRPSPLRLFCKPAKPRFHIGRLAGGFQRNGRPKIPCWNRSGLQPPAKGLGQSQAPLAARRSAYTKDALAREKDFLPPIRFREAAPPRRASGSRSRLPRQDTRKAPQRFARERRLGLNQ